MSKLENILEVRVGKEIFGFNADDIEQILRVPPITHMPLSDHSVLGVAVLSGKIVYAVDLARVLVDESIELNCDNTRLLTLSDGQKSEAFVVDEVLGMIDVDEKNLEQNIDENSLLYGFYKTVDHVVQLLNIKNLISTLKIDRFSPKSLDTLNESIEKDKMDLKESVKEDFKRALFFKAKDERFAIDIEILRELIFVPNEITPIAGSDAFGMITLRDEVIAMLDMNSILGFSYKEPDDKSRALIAWHKGMAVALLVDEVEEVKDLSSENLETMPENLADNLIEFIYKDSDDVVSVISNDYVKNLIREYHIESEDKKENKQLKSLEADVSEIAVFKIGTEEYAFDIEEVQEIIRFEEITPVPEAPPYVEGILNLRGSVIAIISLCSRLGFDCEITDKTKIIVCSVGSEKIGFIVDDVSEILFVEDRFISKSASEESLFDEIINLEDGKRVILKIRVQNLIDEETLEHIKMMEK